MQLLSCRDKYQHLAILVFQNSAVQFAISGLVSIISQEGLVFKHVEHIGGGTGHG